jgi:diaminopimelate dehydrogenase
MNRLLAESILPQGKSYTFWGKGVSQGHSDAIRRIKGVKKAVQYTIPVQESLKKVRDGEMPDLTTREKHRRECFVVVEEGADKEKISHEIKTMPAYFKDYETKVTFISEEEFMRDHTGMPHGGFVIHSGRTGAAAAHNQVIEFSLQLESNPEFTSSILVAYARAVYRLNREGQIGAKTVFDIPLAYLSSRTPEDLRRELL